MAWLGNWLNNNYKKKDYNTKYNLSNTFKKITKEREKTFKKLMFKLIINQYLEITLKYK